MFGIIRPCRHRLSERLRDAWTAHLCGLCLALRDDHGQSARVATNYDGLIISVLVEAQVRSAQERSAGRRRAGPCPLRGMRRAEVARGEGARLAAAVSLVLASAKVNDHVQDGDGVFARRPVAGGARVVAQRWARQGAGSAGRVGFDTTVMTDAVHRQGLVESRVGPGVSVLVATEPTETATAAAFAHTAVLARRPANAEPLAEAGRLFGRLAHLLDAVEDALQDQADGAWNPLLATGTAPDEAYRLCRDAATGIRLALRDVEFTDQELVHTLLVHEVDAAVDRTFTHAGFGHLVEPRAHRHGGSGHTCGATRSRSGRDGTDPLGGVTGDLLFAAETHPHGADRGPDSTPDPAGTHAAAGPAAPRATEAGATAGSGPDAAWPPPQGPGQAPNQPPPQGPGAGNPFGPQQPGGPGWTPQQPGGPWNPPPGGGGRPPQNRNPLLGCMVWFGLCCTCQACCKSSFPDPCDGHPREGLCHKCDCDCDCCSGCDCDCDCGDCCCCDGCCDC